MMTKDTTKFCPYCKEEIKADAIKCRHCGSMLANETIMVAGGSTGAIRVALAGKYEILEEIGRGGMAVVYKAIQKNLERVVALKALPPTLIHDTAFLERFHREARSAAKLSHPNIIIVHDEGVDGEIHYIAMEYLQGIDLNHLIQQQGKISVEDVIEYAAPIASALEYAHSRGLVHRDVKSSNIFIAEHKRPVLTDFGIAHASSGTRLTMEGTVLGTPDFMSPEQAAGKELDGRSDLYALGVVMYHALTGRLPFQSDNPLTTIYKLVNENYIPVSQLASVPAWLEAVIARCMEKDPLKRVQTGGELAQLLRSRRSPATLAVPLGSPTVAMNTQTINGGTRSMPGQRTPTPRGPIHEARPVQNKRSRGGLMATLLVLFLILGAGGGYFAYRAGMFGPSTVLVPSVMGSSWDAAQKTLERAGFRGVVVHGPTTGKTIVVDQDPAGGTSAKKGVSISIATRRATVVMPSLKLLSLAQADSTLRSLGLSAPQPLERAGPPEEKGRVVAQIPEAGAQVEDGTSITLVIGG